MRPPPCFDDKESRRIIDQICRQNNVDANLLVELCEVVHNYSGSGRPEGINHEIAQAIDSFVQRNERGAHKAARG